MKFLYNFFYKFLVQCFLLSFVWTDFWKMLWIHMIQLCEISYTFCCSTWWSRIVLFLVVILPISFTLATVHAYVCVCCIHIKRYMYAYRKRAAIKCLELKRRNILPKWRRILFFFFFHFFHHIPIPKNKIAFILFLLLNPPICSFPCDVRSYTHIHKLTRICRRKKNAWNVWLLLFDSYSLIHIFLVSQCAPRLWIFFDSCDDNEADETYGKKERLRTKEGERNRKREKKSIVVK